MVRVRPRLVEFAAGMLGGLARADQRAKGELYVRGLLLDGKRKSMQPMAARLGVDHQQLQQFVSSSTWDYAEVRGRLARWAETFIGPRAFVVDDTGYPKDGAHSPGVARMYSGSLGKVGNCQIGVSVHAVTDWASATIDWRLFIPRSWDDTATEHPDDRDVIAGIRARRARSRIPDHVRHQEKWRQALDMLDEITGDEQVGGWGLDPLPVVGDAGYGDCTEFRLELERRGLSYVLVVKATTSAYAADAEPVAPPYSGRGRPPVPGYLEGRPPSPRSLWLPVGAHCVGSPGATAPARTPGTRPRR
jgi:SRSO17 transposase